jgi:predicted nucleic acid-binding Zn ribbon protein
MPTVGEHRHCRVCGRVTEPDRETCSETCAAERARRLSSARNYRYLLYGTIALLLIIFLSAVRI